ncbi:cytochrome p450 monooxygenase [Colletotrichum truncatum]|uniref:Cytochrome p450 monooxygenase n=1 Tax=Colletotrichum truncatum TaxID=5467 RepID=A0ACC3YNS5_COLTU|nr:cytochrome p450 monooxygenase [Colletotrichum truncatum]KAF6781836.1 cytochrome p450 monooxygenase [Colletotrichum truncatum]
MLWWLWSSVIVAAAMYGGFCRWKKSVSRLALPVVGSTNDPDLTCAMLEGYKKHPDTPFIIASDPPRVVLPMSLYNEVVYADESNFSFRAELYELFLGRFTHIGERAPEVISAVRGDLTRNLNGILPLIQAEIGFGLGQAVGSGNEWKTLKAYQTVLRMVGLMSGRIFVGLPLSRDKEWLATSINFAVDVSKSSAAMLRLNPSIRSFFLPYLPEVKHLLREKEKAYEWMRPLVKEYVQDQHEFEQKPPQPGSKGAFISWIMKYLPQEQRTAETIGKRQILLSFAALHTTSITATFVIFDLLSRPQYIQPLREEIDQVIAKDGFSKDEDGHLYLSKSSVSQLKNLDSFIKESQRMSPLNIGGSIRRARKDYTFSNGLKIPAALQLHFLYGAYTEFLSPEYNAGTNNAPPAEFDGFRFARLREMPGREMKHQATATGPDSFNFGSGPHACPGRFFAIYMIKCIIIELLMHYDVELKKDSDAEVKRPLKFVKDSAQMMPNPAVEIKIRKRMQG